MDAKLESALKECVRGGNLVWNDYLTQGPGVRSNKHAYTTLVESAQQLRDHLREHSYPSDTIAELKQALETLCELADRCVNRSEGLCFITGEAGLVPRQDLHEKFEKSLKFLATLADNGV